MKIPKIEFISLICVFRKCADAKTISTVTEMYVFYTSLLELSEIQAYCMHISRSEVFLYNLKMNKYTRKMIKESYLNPFKMLKIVLPCPGPSGAWAVHLTPRQIWCPPPPQSSEVWIHYKVERRFCLDMILVPFIEPATWQLSNWANI